MEDHLEKVIALDSDDEGENQNEAINSVSRCSLVGRFSGRHAVGLLRRQKAPTGYFRRLDKVGEHVSRGLVSAISGRSDEKSTAGRTSPYDDDRFQERRVVVDSVMSRSSEKKTILVNPGNTGCLNMEKENSKEELPERKLHSHELNYIESPQVSDLQDKAMQFIDDYISVCNMNSYKDIPTRKSSVMKSPPSLRSMGIQSLARRLTLGSTASTLTAFDWAEKQVEKTECPSPRLHNNSIFGFRGAKCGSVSVDQESSHVDLHYENSILQPEEKLPGNIWSPNNCSEKIGLISELCIVPDSEELDERLDAGISSQNAYNVEQCRLTSEVSYVGLDTQMAAEAMEELLHSGPSRVDACFTHESSDNTLLGTSDAVNNKDVSNLACHKMAFVDWRCKEKRSKSIKISTVKDKCFSAPAAKRFNNQRGTVSQSLVGKKQMTKKLMADEESNNKRKLIRSFHKGTYRKGLNRTCSGSNSGPSFEVKTDSAKGKENCYPDVADTTLSELNPCVYPKGKRTRQCMSCLTISTSDQCFPFAAVDNNLEMYPKVKLNEEAVSGVEKLLVYNRRRKVSLRRQQEHCSPPDEGSINMKSKDSGKRKLSLSPLSRSPLMKELMRLGYTDSMPDFLPKNSRRRRATDKVCILLSQNLDARTLEQQKKIVARLGFSIASCSSDATHFVADRFVRTKNMLEVIGLGKPVVTHLWLEGCAQAGYVIDEKSCILRDEKKEKEFGFNMHVTLTRASQFPLLKGRKVLITPNVKPGLDVITSLVKVVQGQVVQKILDAETEDEFIHNGLLILSSEKDIKICLQFLQKGASFYDSELLLNGIVTQKLEYDRYRLFQDHEENGHC